MAASLSGSGSGRRRALAEINVTPLVDVMLVLLIISMLAAPMLQRGINLELPATAHASEIREARIVVSVDRERRRVELALTVTALGESGGTVIEGEAEIAMPRGKG